MKKKNICGKRISGNIINALNTYSITVNNSEPMLTLIDKCRDSIMTTIIETAHKGYSLVQVDLPSRELLRYFEGELMSFGYAITILGTCKMRIDWCNQYDKYIMQKLQSEFLLSGHTSKEKFIAKGYLNIPDMDDYDFGSLFSLINNILNKNLSLYTDSDIYKTIIKPVENELWFCVKGYCTVYIKSFIHNGILVNAEYWKVVMEFLGEFT
jgi:hypothetical protein